MKKLKQVGLFDLFDKAIADELGVDVETYIETIDKFGDEEMTFIIESIISPTAIPSDKQKAKNLFNSQL